MFSRVEYFVGWRIFQEPLTWAFHKFLDKLIFKSLALAYGNLAAVFKSSHSSYPDSRELSLLWIPIVISYTPFITCYFDWVMFSHYRIKLSLQFTFNCVCVLAIFYFPSHTIYFLRWYGLLLLYFLPSTSFFPFPLISSQLSEYLPHVPKHQGHY